MEEKKSMMERLNEKVWGLVDREREMVSSVHLAPRLKERETGSFSCACGHDLKAHEWDCGMIFCNKCDARPTVSCRRFGFVKEKCHSRAVVLLLVGLFSVVSYTNLGLC
jgi:hypothetical protein